MNWLIQQLTLVEFNSVNIEVVNHDNRGKCLFYVHIYNNLQYFVQLKVKVKIQRVTVTMW